MIDIKCTLEKVYTCIYNISCNKRNSARTRARFYRVVQIQHEYKLCVNAVYLYQNVKCTLAALIDS